MVINTVDAGDMYMGSLPHYRGEGSYFDKARFFEARVYIESEVLVR